MKNIRNLTKIYIYEMLASTFNFSNKRTRTKNIITITFLGLLIIGSLGYNYYLMADNLNSFGMAKNILTIGMLFSIVMVLMLTLTDTQGYLYRSKDFEFVSSLPLKYNEIIIAKYISSYLINLLYTIFVALPAFVVYFVVCGVSVYKLVILILILPFLASFSHLISCLLAWLVSIVSIKSKNQTKMRSIVSLILSLSIIVLVYFANTNALTDLFAKELPLWIKIVFPYIYCFYEAITNSSLMFMFLGMLVASAYIVVSVLVLNIGYKKINSGSLVSAQSKSKKTVLEYRKSNVIVGLLKKEAKNFFTCPVYFINGIMGALMSILISIICLTIYFEVGNLPFVQDIFVIIQVFAIVICAGIAPTTAVSISVEGTSFLSTKSLPISFKQLATSKILFNILINLPALLIANIIFAVGIKLNFVVFIISELYVIISVLIHSCFGLICNLKHPRLVWTTETQAVKSGMSMFITMVVDMLLGAIPMILFFTLLDVIAYIKVWAYLLICAGLMALVLVGLIIYLYKRGRKLYLDVS